MTEAEHLAACHPWLRSRVVEVLARWRASASPGDTIRLAESVRSLETQQTYYARGASKADGVSAFSLHQYAPALAVDCLVIRAGRVVASISDPAWQRYGAIAREEGLDWGGDWSSLRDGPHVEVPLVERVRLVQAAVGATPDGQWGPATTAAVSARVTLRQGRTGWASMSPRAWAELVAG